MIARVHVSTSKTYVVKSRDDATAANFCKRAKQIAEQHNGVVIENRKIQECEYLMVVYFSSEDITMIWKSAIGSQNIEMKNISTSRTYIISDGANDCAARQFCMQAKDSACKYKGAVMTEIKLKEGAYLLVVYFSDESYMNAWEIFMGIN